MPHDAKYGDNDATLRAFLVAHFEGIIKDEFNKVQQFRHELNQTKEPKDFDNLYVTKHTIKERPESNISDIADINFGKSKCWDLTYLHELNSMRNDYIKLNT